MPTSSRLRSRASEASAPEARLDLHPAPGLVVVAGRNGSGKSTFSQAVEVALTRTSYRWDAKKGAGDWRAGWRNLHADDLCHIRVELAEEGVGTTTVAADLGTATKEPREGIFWAQRPGQQRDRSADPLGWLRSLELYRPLLSYDELGGILESRPSDLYEKLSTILGLGRITDAQERLDELVMTLTASRREATAAVKNLRQSLNASTDPRATEAATLLNARDRDLDALAGWPPARPGRLLATCRSCGSWHTGRPECRTGPRGRRRFRERAAHADPSSLATPHTHWSTGRACSSTRSPTSRWPDCSAVRPTGRSSMMVTSRIWSSVSLTTVALGGTTGMMCVRQDKAIGMGTKDRGRWDGAVLIEGIDQACGHKGRKRSNGCDL